MNLYDLKTEYQNIQELIENGEPLDEELEKLNVAIEEKADGYARIIKNIEGNIEAIKSEEKRLFEKRKVQENAIARLKSNLFSAMKETGKENFKTDLFSFSVQKNGGKLPIIFDKDISEIPDGLLQIEKKLNSEIMAKYIEETGDVTYAHFGERGESLRIR